MHSVRMCAQCTKRVVGFHCGNDKQKQKTTTFNIHQKGKKNQTTTKYNYAKCKSVKSKFITN